MYHDEMRILYIYNQFLGQLKCAAYDLEVKFSVIKFEFDLYQNLTFD